MCARPKALQAHGGHAGADGGTPVTYPGFGTSFMLPIYPPYDSVTVVLCGATWGYNSIYCALLVPLDCLKAAHRPAVSPECVL